MATCSIIFQKLWGSDIPYSKRARPGSEDTHNYRRGEQKAGMDFALQHDLPGHALDPEWRTLLAQQAGTLELILSLIADTVAVVSADPQPEQVHRLHTTLHTTEHLLWLRIGGDHGHGVGNAGEYEFQRAGLLGKQS